MHKPIQLTDDGIRDFIVNLVDYLERHPATFDNKGQVTDEGYDYLNDFVYKQLEPFSNGYINYN